MNAIVPAVHERINTLIEERGFQLIVLLSIALRTNEVLSQLFEDNLMNHKLREIKFNSHVFKFAVFIIFYEKIIYNAFVV